MQNGSTDTCVKESKDTNTTHCYVIHTLPVLFSFLCTFFVFVLFHLRKQCSFSYLLISDLNVTRYWF